MKNRIIFIAVLIGLITSGKVLAQNELKPVEHKIIAEGTDSPIPELQIVCFNSILTKTIYLLNSEKNIILTTKHCTKRKCLSKYFNRTKIKKDLTKLT